MERERGRKCAFLYILYWDPLTLTASRINVARERSSRNIVSNRKPMGLNSFSFSPFYETSKRARGGRYACIKQSWPRTKRWILVKTEHPGRALKFNNRALNNQLFLFILELRTTRPDVCSVKCYFPSEYDTSKERKKIFSRLIHHRPAKYLLSFKITCVSKIFRSCLKRISILPKATILTKNRLWNWSHNAVSTLLLYVSFDETIRAIDDLAVSNDSPSFHRQRKRERER